MDSPDIRRAIRGSLLLVFLVSLVVGTGGFYLLLRQQAVRDAAGQARLLLATASGVRDYTNAHAVPLVALLPPGQFREESVPSFAAQAVFRGVTANTRAFTYREAALNPTATSDRASAFEVGLIQQFRADPTVKEISGSRDVGADRQFYLARPIRITDPACLVCHDTPARAPASMLAKYGSANGFGWTLNETVGVQLLAVPVTAQFRSTLVLTGLLAAGLTVIFVLAYLALSATLELMVAAPLAQLTASADEASVSSGATVKLPNGGVREVRALAEALERLRISLAKSMAELAKARTPAP